MGCDIDLQDDVACLGRDRSGGIVGSIVCVWKLFGESSNAAEKISCQYASSTKLAKIKNVGIFPDLLQTISCQERSIGSEIPRKTGLLNEFEDC